MGKVYFDEEEQEIKNPEMIFTDRDNPRKLFWEAYDRLGADEFFVINFHGFGGIGKSWLCRHLNQSLKSGVHPESGEKLTSKSLILNFEDLKNDCEKVNVLANLANKFEGECKYTFPLFKYGLYVYYRAQGYSNESPEINRIQDNILVGTALDVLGFVPVVGGIGSFLLKGADSLSASLRNRILKNSEWIKRLDNLSSEDISEELVKIFAKELREQTQKETAPVVVFLDTYEQLQNYIYQIASAKVSEEWLWSRSGLIQRVPNVLWVLAGQRPVDWGQEDAFWKSEENIIQEEIREITDSELLKKMLADIGIAEEDIAEKIVEKTGGVPIHLALCKDTYFNLKREGKQPSVQDFDMEYSQLARRFIGGLRSELKDIVNLLACLESWSLKDVEGLQISADAYEYVLQLSFIKQSDGMYFMHHSVQEIIYKGCPALIQNRCLEYFRQCIGEQSLTTTEKKDYFLKKMKLELELISRENNPETRQKETEEFIARNEKGIREYAEDYNFFTRVQTLLQEKLPEGTKVPSFEKELDIYALYHCTLNGEYGRARSYIEEKQVLAGHLRLENELRRHLYLAYAVYQQHEEDFQDAKTYLMECYELEKKNENLYAKMDILGRMGDVCAKLGQYQEVTQYSQMGEELLKNVKLDTRLAAMGSKFYINQCKKERFVGTPLAALGFLAKAEALLKPYAELENEGILYQLTVIYQQYFFIYESAQRKEEARAYTQKTLELSQEIYRINASTRNYRSVAIGYLNCAMLEPSEEQKDRYYDYGVAILKEIYERQPDGNALNEWFRMNRMAADDYRGETTGKYIQAGKKMLSEKYPYAIAWKEIYRFYRSCFSYFLNSRQYPEAAEQMRELEEKLEGHRDRLSEKDYLNYLSWNAREKGILSEKRGELYDTIRYYEKENFLEYKLYRSYAEYADGVSYADSCRILADAYMKKNLYGQALVFAKKQIAVEEKQAAEFQRVNQIRRLSDSYEILAKIYEKQHDFQKAAETRNREAAYRRQIYQMQKTVWNLILLYNTYLQKNRLRQEPNEQVKREYEELLQEFQEGSYEIEKQKHKTLAAECMDYLECSLGIFSFLSGENLEKAWRDVEKSKCPFSNFSGTDRRFYLGKLEKKMFVTPIPVTVLSREEGRRLLEE